jgi:hypothetical protein
MAPPVSSEQHLSAALEAHAALPSVDRRAIEAMLNDRERLMVRELIRRHQQSGHLFPMMKGRLAPSNPAFVGLSPRMVRHLTTLTDVKGVVVGEQLTEPTRHALQSALDRRNNEGRDGNPNSLRLAFGAIKRWWQGLWT